MDYICDKCGIENILLYTLSNPNSNNPKFFCRSCMNFFKFWIEQQNLKKLENIEKAKAKAKKTE